MNLALVPARAGSKGVPGKNLRTLAGTPLIAHTIQPALEVFDRVFVTTDSAEIADVARQYGAEVIDRPDALAGDTAAMADVVDHAIHRYTKLYTSPDRVFLLQPTSPFRTSDDILKAAKLLDRGDCDAAMAVFEAPSPPEWGLRATAEGFLEPRFPVSEYLARRQDLPSTYCDGPVYAIETGAFFEYRRFLTPRTRFTVVPPDRGVDIDTEMDLLFAEFLLQRGSGE